MTDNDLGTAKIAQLEANREVVAQAVARLINEGDLDAADELYAASIAADVKAWVAPFRASFPDVHMSTVALIADGDIVVGHFRCSGTHLGLSAWPPPPSMCGRSLTRSMRVAPGWPLSRFCSRCCT